MTAETGDTAVRDAGLIAAAQKVEHYEMSGTARHVLMRRFFGYGNAVSLLEQTLLEEKEADRKLDDLAESTVNEVAMNTREMEDTVQSRRASKLAIPDCLRYPRWISNQY